MHLQCSDGVCIGWACALWLQRLCSVAVLDCFNYNYVASKGDVKAFFWLAVAVWAVFGSCPDGVWVFLHLQCFA